MNLRFSFRLAALLTALLAGATSVHAWSPTLEQSLYRDAQRLLPRSLAILMRNRERLVLDAAQSPPQGMADFRSELMTGQLKDATFGALDTELKTAVELMQHRQLGAGLVRMGALLRIAVDVSDPVLVARDGELPPGLAAEYYAFLESNLDKIPVVLEDPHALRLARSDLPGFWQSLLARSRDDAPVLRTEMFVRGRVVRHETLDYRSPVFGVGSLAYSRAVTGIAATWLAAWRSAHGDMTDTSEPRVIGPRSPVGEAVNRDGGSSASAAAR
jgi:hypothetical protein